MKKKVLVVGSVNMDFVTEVSHIPKVGETILGSPPQYYPGGKGANQAVAMARLGTDVTIYGAVGNDDYGKQLKQNLVDAKVNAAVKIVESQPTGMAIIMLEASTDNSIVVIGGANNCVQPDEINENLLNDFDIIVLQMEISTETVIKTIELAHEMGKYVVLNLAPAEKISTKLLSKINLLILNESEFTTLFETNDDSEKSLTSLVKQYDMGSILVTMGSKGSVYADGKEYIYEKALSVTTVDTTGAGDAFVGGVVSQIALDKPIADVMKYATKVASIAVTKLGAQSSLPYKEEVIV